MFSIENLWELQAIVSVQGELKVPPLGDILLEKNTGRKEKELGYLHQDRESIGLTQFTVLASVPKTVLLGFPGGSDSKESTCNAGDPGSICGSGRSPGERNSNPLQCSYLENPTDGGAWWAVVHGVAKSQIQLSH